MISLPIENAYTPFLSGGEALPTKARGASINIRNILLAVDKVSSLAANISAVSITSTP
jgi:hypothetical protein